MCGIVGIYHLDGAPVNAQLLLRATRVQSHRGPDDEGFLMVDTQHGQTLSLGGQDTDARLKLPHIAQFQDQHFNLGFGFRRLSILDLSPSGHQPMSSADGRLWIIFNGEIYNYVELRAQLIDQGFQFRTGTDTEVILAAYQHWGQACVEHFNGMWAFAIVDLSTGQLFLARDRFGEKPLHYVYVPGKLFAFASEIKALWATGLAGRSINEEALVRYTYHGQLDAGEQTFYEGVWRLLQAHSLVLKADGTLERRRYWDIDLRDQQKDKSDGWYAEKFRELFFQSIKVRLRSDVPVGSSLSGGLDSSTVVSVMNELLPASAVQKTFSARFDDPAKDEGEWIKEIIAATRVEPHFVWPTGEEMFNELKRVFWHQEEPFGSSSIYAQWCVMRLAKEHGVTVLLDGQGADEMLAGYHVYFNVVADELLRNMSIPAYLDWKRSYKALHGRTLRSAGLRGLIKDSLPALVKRPVKKLLGRGEDAPSVKALLPEYPEEFNGVSELRKTLWWHTTRQGLVELLRYADRNSMAHSREVRLPFLDHELVEFVFRLPERLLLQDGWTKWMLRQSFKGIVPESISGRVDKIGYEPPQQGWLGGRTWQDVMLDQLTRAESSAPSGDIESVAHSSPEPLPSAY